MPAYYSVYGLTLNARQPLPLMQSAPATPNEVVTVDLAGPAGQERLANLKPVNSEEDDSWKNWSTTRVEEVREGDRLYLWVHFRGGIEFLVDRAGAEAWAWWPESIGYDEAVSYLIGPILGTILRLRGATVLHACAISVHGQAIAVLGDAGAGKSSLAAVFAQRGYPILTDDLVALDNRDGVLRIQPGHTWIMVPPETVEVLYGTPDALPQALPPWPKRRLDLTQNGYHHQNEPLPLAAVYFLGQRSHSPRAPFVRRVPPRQALLALLANSNAPRRVKVGMPGRDFDVLARIAAKLPVRRVTPHADRQCLPGLCETILKDFARVSALAAPTVQNESI